MEETQERNFFTFSIKSYCSVSWEWTLLKPSFICLKETHQFLSRSCRHCFTFSQSFSRPWTGKLQTSLSIPWSGSDTLQILQQLVCEQISPAPDSWVETCNDPDGRCPRGKPFCRTLSPRWPPRALPWGIGAFDYHYQYRYLVPLKMFS